MYITSSSPASLFSLKYLTVRPISSQGNNGNCGLQTVEGGEVLAELATATEELPEDSKITLFAPEDAAWPPAEALPTGVELLAVSFLFFG